MYFLDESIVQVWKEEDIGKIILINHRWREKSELSRIGLKGYFQEVTDEQLDAIRSLKNCVNQEEYNSKINIIGEKPFHRLVKYNYLIESEDFSLKRKVWHPQAQNYLLNYLNIMYGIPFPERPLSTTLIPTLRCFGKCVYCMVDSKLDTADIELDSDCWDTITTRVCEELQPCSVEVMGGEPTLRFDALLAIARVAVKYNTYFGFSTNGVILAENDYVYQLRKILDNTKHKISVSLDGTKDIHCLTRPGAEYTKVIKTIRNLSSEGINFGIAVTINKYNVDKIEYIIDSIAEFIPVSVFLGALISTPKNSKVFKEIGITKEQEKQLREIVYRLNEKYQSIEIVYDHEEPVFEKGILSKGSNKIFHNCKAFYSGIAIGPYGNILPCLRASNYPEFNGTKIHLYKGNLRQLWVDSELANIFRSIPLRGKCSECEYNQQCSQGCPLEAYAIDKILGGYDPDCCYKES